MKSFLHAVKGVKEVNSHDQDTYTLSLLLSLRYLTRGKSALTFSAGFLIYDGEGSGNNMLPDQFF